jgi:hypothetical protein
VLAGVLALVLSGCGANSNLALTQGNWSITATPTGNIANNNFFIGGNLTQNGSSLAGTMSVVSSPNCFAPSQTVTFTGTVKGKNVTLTSASVGGEVVSVKATGTSGSALTGTYSIAGGTTCNGQTGTITASPVPSISGTWSGPIVGDFNGDPSVTLSIALTEAATASTDGTFALTGNLTYTGSTCSVSGIIDSSFIAGPYVVLNATTDDGASFSYSALLNNPASPTNMPGGNYGTSGGNCDDVLSVTLTKQ